MAEYTATIAEQYFESTGRIHLSPLEFQKLREWETQNMPLHIPLNTIKELSEWAKEKGVPIRGLNFYVEEIEARFGEWRESQVGR